ncbi:MAG TPA: hypothetical protein VLD67_04095 [Vicinamibacterales bacterium]|nr:hypothetical protein [Vicinamibacterales bacterium]
MRFLVPGGLVALAALGRPNQSPRPRFADGLAQPVAESTLTLPIVGGLAPAPPPRSHNVGITLPRE